MRPKKYRSITVDQRKNRKLYDKLRYQIAIKPHLKPKGRTGVMKIRCPLCSHLIGYQKFLERSPNLKISVKMFWFGGRANIQIQDFTKIEPQIEQNIRETLTHKLKLLLIAFKGELEPFQEAEVVHEVAITKPSGYMEFETIKQIPVSITKEVPL